MRHSFWNRKIPSLFGLIVIIFGITITTLLVRGKDLFQINAIPGNEPKNVVVTNISDSSFTVTYLTDASAIGTINFGKDPDKLDQTALDDRDQLSQTVNNYQAHSITVNSIEPNTIYYFTITSASDIIKDKNFPFKIKTGPLINTPPGFQNPMSGKVINPDNSSPSDGLVYVTIDGAQKLSTILKKDGSYILPLNAVRSQELDKFYQISNDSLIKITINTSNFSSAITTFKDQLNPVPFVTLSNNYDFENANLEPKSTTSANLENRKFPVFKSRLKKTK